MSEKKKELIVFTDGSCTRNGRKGSKGGIGIYFPNKELKNISKVYRLENCTNQRTELYAILTAIKYINANLNIYDYQIVIKTDSRYSIECITKWVYAWLKNGWKTKTGTLVSNRDFIEVLHKYYEKYDIDFIHVDAHTGKNDINSIGNTYADKLATQATKRAQSENNNNNTYRNQEFDEPYESNELSETNDLIKSNKKSKLSDSDHIYQKRLMTSDAQHQRCLMTSDEDVLMIKSSPKKKSSKKYPSKSYSKPYKSSSHSKSSKSFLKSNKDKALKRKNYQKSFKKSSRNTRYNNTLDDNFIIELVKK